MLERQTHTKRTKVTQHEDCCHNYVLEYDLIMKYKIQYSDVQKSMYYDAASRFFIYSINLMEYLKAILLSGTSL